MDPPMDHDEALQDNPEANAEALIPEEIDEDDESMMSDTDDEDLEGAFPPDLHSLGARFQNISVRAIFQLLHRSRGPVTAAPIVLYLLYPDLRQDIEHELRSWILSSGHGDMWRIEAMFDQLGELNLAEQIEQECSEEMLEFVDVLGPLILEARRDLILIPGFTRHDITLPLHIPLGAVVAAKLLQYAKLFESVHKLTLLCENPYRALRPDEVEQLVNAVLDLKQLVRLEISMDMTGVLLVELCARLKDLKNFSHLFIRADDENALQELPNESRLIRSIQRISSLDTLHLFSAIMGESTVDLFSSSEASYTKLKLVRCLHVIGDNEGKDPSELPLAVALASNTRLVELCLESVQGSYAFFVGIEQGLLNNRTLRTLRVTNFAGPAHQRIPEFAYFGWIQSIRLHHSLRRLAVDMGTWSGRVADALCSAVRDNTSLHSLELLPIGRREESDNEFDPEWIGAVLEALQANRAIVDVRIRAGSDFGERNWDRLAELLNVNESIKTIHLDAGDETIPERVIQLLQRVKSNRTLKRLGLKNAKFLQHHTEALVQMLADNYVLVSLFHEIGEPRDEVQRREPMPALCSDEGSQRLLSGILDLNYYGRKYMRTEPNSVFRGVALLSPVSSNLDAVYFHIRENPRLCDRREWK